MWCFCSCFRCCAPRKADWRGTAGAGGGFFAHLSLGGGYVILDSGSTNQAGCRMKLSPGQCCHYPNSAPVTDSHKSGTVTAAVQRKGSDDRSTFGGCYRDRSRPPNEAKDNTFRSGGSNTTVCRVRDHKQKSSGILEQNPSSRNATPVWPHPPVGTYLS